MHSCAAGAGIALYAEKGTGESYQPHITSYDYDCMVSEAGQYGQPGIGGPNKYEVRNLTSMGYARKGKSTPVWMMGGLGQTDGVPAPVR